MKGLHWWTLLIGYLVGSFFGITALFGLFQKKPAQTAPAAA